MVSTAQFAMGIIGNVISMCLFFSPVPTFVKIYRMQSVGDFSSVRYVTTLLNCLLWLFYGSPFVKMGVLVRTINGAGMLIEIIYLFMFLFYSRKNTQKLDLVSSLSMVGVILVFFAVVVLVNMLALHHKHEREVVIGVLCVIVGTSMYVSPLTVMRAVITTRSTEYMPLPLSVFNLNGIVWTIYALIGHDVFITIPNALGVFFALCQLTLYLCFCGTSRHEKPTASTKLNLLNLR